MAKKHPRWQLAKKILTLLFFIAVVVLLVVYARNLALIHAKNREAAA